LHDFALYLLTTTIKTANTTRQGLPTRLAATSLTLGTNEADVEPEGESV